MSPRISDGVIVAEIFRRLGDLDDLSRGWCGEGDHADAAAEQAELGGCASRDVDDAQVLRR
jgi:hypothetical protein